MASGNRTHRAVPKCSGILTDQKLNNCVICSSSERKCSAISLITDKRTKIAFSAGIASGADGWSGDTLVFPDVIYSEGKGYDSKTGVFTAPTEGTYLFYISIQSAWQKYIYLDIVLNGASKVRSMAQYNSGNTISMHQTGTNLVILYLTVGDRVWVKRGGGTGYYSNSYHVCTFSGVRLY